MVGIKAGYIIRNHWVSFALHHLMELVATNVKSHFYNTFSSKMKTGLEIQYICMSYKSSKQDLKCFLLFYQRIDWNERTEEGEDTYYLIVSVSHICFVFFLF